jgi:hypothetical protein
MEATLHDMQQLLKPLYPEVTALQHFLHQQKEVKVTCLIERLCWVDEHCRTMLSEFLLDKQ